MKKSIDGLPAHSDDALALVRRDIDLEVRPRTSRKVSITVTSPAINEKVRKTFEERTASMQTLQANVQLGVEFVDQFLDRAFDEGLDQTVDALTEYWLMRAKLGGGKKKDRKKEKEKEKEKSTKPQEQTEPAPHPIPIPVDDDDDKKPAGMRFQVQWNSRAKDNTKGQFSEVAVAPASVGVSTTQAVVALKATHAKVTPSRAKKNAEPAVALQINWINKRPPAGVDGQFSRSALFEYDYPDARVDVEGLRGHNLRQ